MKAKEVVTLARKLMDFYGLDHVPFKLNSRKNALGVCRFRGGKVSSIEFSTTFLPYVSDEDIKDVILHEIAHALAGRHANHGPAWKRKAREVGANPNRLHDMDPEVLARYMKETSKYRATCGCPSGKHVTYFNRMGKHWQNGAYRCAKGKRFTVETLK